MYVPWFMISVVWKHVRLSLKVRLKMNVTVGVGNETKLREIGMTVKRFSKVKSLLLLVSFAFV